MHIIGEHRFVIETKVPVSFSNKQVESDQGLVTVPDGETQYEYMWFCGVGAHPDNPNVIGAVWSPYPEQAAKYKDKYEAEVVNDQILGPQSGGYVLSWETCHKEFGRRVIVPIPNASIADAKSNSGINGQRYEN